MPSGRTDHPASFDDRRQLLLAELPGLYATALLHTGSQEQAVELVRATLRASSADEPSPDGLRVSLHTRLWTCYLATDPTGSASGRMAPEAGTPVGDALASLPAAARTAVYLVDAEGLTYTELAQVLGLPTDMAAALLHAARRMLVSDLAAA